MVHVYENHYETKKHGKTGIIFRTKIFKESDIETKYMIFFDEEVGHDAFFNDMREVCWFISEDRAQHCLDIVE